LVLIRFVAAVALAVLLAGCSFFDFSDHSARYQESGGPGAARPAQSVQLAALPGYLSDEDIVPARPAQSAQLAALPGYLSDEDIVPARPTGSALGLWQAVPRKPSGFAGIPSRRPEPALAPVRVSPPLRAESYTLADLVEDQAWRQRTSRQLKRLFQ